MTAIPCVPMLAGFDIGGTNVRALLVDPSTGQVLHSSRDSSAGGGPALVAKVLEMVANLERTYGCRVEAIGLGVAGLVSRSGTIHYSPNLPDLIEFPIGPEVEAASRVPVVVGNDAASGAWAEAKFGAGRGADDFIYVALGTGIGTGFVADGRLMTGANGFAGESGHMVVDMDGPAHRTGQRGPWEYFASGTALGRMAREAAQSGAFAKGIELAGDVASITGYHVAEALVVDDAEASAIFDGFCREVARGIANLAVIFDPQRVVVGGGLAEIGTPLKDGTQRWLDRLLLGGEHRPRVEVTLAELGSDSGAIGAVLLAAEALSGD